MSEPLITISYKDYLELQKTELQIRFENTHNIRRIIENNENIKTRDDLLSVIRTLENSYLYMEDKMKEGEQK